MNTGDGCLASTPGDMAIFARALLAGFAPLIRPETFEQMRVPDGYGYALNTLKGGSRLGHAGSMLGHFASLIVQPDAGLGAVVLMNGPGKPEMLANRLLDLVTGAPAGAEGEAPEPAAEARQKGDRTGDPHDWDALTGVYRTHNPWYSHFRIAVEDGRLRFLDAFHEEEPIIELEPGLFRVGGESSPERLHFEMWIDGIPHRAVYSGAAYYRTSAKRSGT
jgi:CubicO group peptidase (beta-lactamase class C family)